MSGHRVRSADQCAINQYHRGTFEEKRKQVDEEGKRGLQRKSSLAMASARSFWHVSRVRTGFPKDPPLAGGMGGFMELALGKGFAVPAPQTRFPQICHASNAHASSHAGPSALCGMHPRVCQDIESI